MVDFPWKLLGAPEGLIHHINDAVQLHLQPIKIVLSNPDGRPPRVNLIKVPYPHTAQYILETEQSSFFHGV